MAVGVGGTHDGIAADAGTHNFSAGGGAGGTRGGGRRRHSDMADVGIDKAGRNIAQYKSGQGTIGIEQNAASHVLDWLFQAGCHVPPEAG